VGAQHGGEEAWLVIQLGGEGPLLAAILGTLLHGRQDTRLFALRHASKTHSCNGKKIGFWLIFGLVSGA